MASCSFSQPLNSLDTQPRLQRDFKMSALDNADSVCIPPEKWHAEMAQIFNETPTAIVDKHYVVLPCVNNQNLSTK